MQDREAAEAKIRDLQEQVDWLQEKLAGSGGSRTPVGRDSSADKGGRSKMLKTIPALNKELSEAQ